MNEISKKVVARCPGTSYADLVEADSRPVPDFMREDRYEYLGSEPITAERYVGDAFFRREIEHMWPNVWQFAAREEEMLEPDDMVVYENAGRSYLLIRQADGSVRAFHNVCLHRGRRLRTESGSASAIQCPYHGFTWNNDGSLRQIPCRWDFGHLSDEKMKLPEAEVGRWGGYIFIRENPGGPSLEEWLDPVPEHFARWAHERRTTAAWVAKVMDANWKAVMEAFMEAWHSYTTHPQIVPFTGDANTRYNIYSDTVNSAISAQGIMSPQLDREGKDEQWIADQIAAYYSRAQYRQDGKVKVPPGETARKVLGARAREQYAPMFGYDIDHATDSELLDSIYYGVFPNFAPWGGFKPNICYRFRPWPDQHRTLMEVRILTPVHPGEPIPPAVPMRLLGDDESWSQAHELGVALGEVLDQDVTNVAEVQAGLRASKNGLVELGEYQEVRIRHFHQTLDKFLAAAAQD